MNISVLFQALVQLYESWLYKKWRSLLDYGGQGEKYISVYHFSIYMSIWLNGLISFIIIIIVAHGIILYHMIKHYVGMFYVIAAYSSRTTGHRIRGWIRNGLIIQWMPTSCSITDIR